MHPQSIRATVSSDTIKRVGRLFNNTLADVLNELLQNARRAGATQIDIEMLVEEDETTLHISDNGVGIADPQTVLTLGKSDWDNEIAQREDPGGMGMFSLAGQHITITSRQAVNSTGWRVTIPPHAWDGSADLPIEPANHRVGTTIDIALPRQWDDRVVQCIQAAARYYPIPVYFIGEEVEQYDWLDGAIHTAEWNGCRIGVFTGIRRGEPTLNFHGLQVTCKLPTVEEVRGGTSFYAKVDIQNCPSLQLVLPARKEAVSNAALDDLRRAVERVTFEAIGQRPGHQLPFTSWRHAAEIGVMLPEAQQILESWNPSIADHSSDYGLSKTITSSEAILIEDDEPDVGQCVARALGDTPLRARLAHERAAYVGYSWYDRLPRLDNISFAIEHPGGTFTVISATCEPLPTGHLKATAIILIAELTEGASTTIVSRATDLALVTDTSIWDGLDAARVIYLDGLEPDDLIEIMDRVYFSPNEDSDSDSWDTQHRRFEADARDEVIKLLRGTDEALCDQFRCLLRDNRWLIPTGVRIKLAVDGDAIDVSLERFATEIPARSLH